VTGIRPILPESCAYITLAGTNLCSKVWHEPDASILYAVGCGIRTTMSSLLDDMLAQYHNGHVLHFVMSFYDAC
jgi:hypothetical protein